MNTFNEKRKSGIESGISPPTKLLVCAPPRTKTNLKSGFGERNYRIATEPNLAILLRRTTIVWIVYESGIVDRLFDSQFTLYSTLDSRFFV